MLPNLLDEWMPVLAGVEINDDPIAPMTKTGKRLVAEQGDDAKIEWVHRSDRYHEKLATPDVTIADLIGEIDLVKHAEGRYLSDESTMHFGLIPRSNRGIFAINELPDLAPRIQVGLFNVLEERDVQIRGYPIRLDLDVCLVFSANPEDYTNRGRIVTPLKDRIGSVIRTHYPETIGEGIEIAEQNAWLDRAEDEPPPAACAWTCRGSWRKWSKKSSASRAPARTSARRPACRSAPASPTSKPSSATPSAAGILTGEKRVVPRICDLNYPHRQLPRQDRNDPGRGGRGRGQADPVAGRRGGEERSSPGTTTPTGYDNITEQFKGNLTFPAGDDLSADEFVANMKAVKGLPQAAATLAKEMKLDGGDPATLASVGRVPAGRALRQQPAEQVQRRRGRRSSRSRTRGRSGDVGRVDRCRALRQENA